MKLQRRFYKFWTEWSKKRLINKYLLSQRTGPAAEWFFRYLLIFLGGFLVIFMLAPTLRAAAIALSCLVILLLLCAYLFRQEELQQLREASYEKIAQQEFKKRLDNTPPVIVLQLLQEVLTCQYGLQDLQLTEKHLEGRYRGEPIVVYYRSLPEDDILEAREIMGILKQCRAAGIRRVRILTNREFSERIANLGSRFELELKTYNGDKLRSLLKDSELYPTVSEMDNILKRASEQRVRSLTVIRKQALQKDKALNYFLSGLTLLCLGWFKIGLVSANFFFGGLLLVLAVIALIIQWLKKEKELVF